MMFDDFNTMLPSVGVRIKFNRV